MRTKARLKAARVPAKRVLRLPAAARRHDIATKAAHYFAARGFDGSTRDLARYLGITQPLLYRYFPTKEHIIKAVYQAVYLDVWKASWDALLVDRSRPLRERLHQFYGEYTEIIMNEEWMRIYFFAALRGAEINKLYIKFIEERILRRIIVEFLHECGVAADETEAVAEMEHVWFLQSAIFYYGVRLYVYKLRPAASRLEVIDAAIDMFVTGYRARLAARGLLPGATPLPRALAARRRRAARLA